MHANPLHPNILQDMQAAAKGARLANPLAKSNLIPHKDYRHCADAQVYDSTGRPINAPYAPYKAETR